MNNNKFSYFPIPYTPEYFEISICNFFKIDAAYLAKERPDLQNFPVIFLCFINRSGSNFLSDILSNSSQLKLCGEVLHADQTISICKKRNIVNYDDYIFNLIDHSKKEGTIPVFKISWDQLYFLTRIGIIGKCLKNLKFIYCFRENVLEQGLSYEKALLSGNWIQLDNLSEIDKVKDIQNIKIESENTLSHALRFLFSNAYFELYFRVFAVYPLIFKYEEIIAKSPNEIFDKSISYIFGAHENVGFISGKTIIQRKEKELKELHEKLTEIRNSYFN